MRNRTLIVAAVLSTGSLADATGARDVATVTGSTSDGVSSELIISAPAAHDGGTSAVAAGSGTVLWQRHFADPIYTSTGLSEPAGLAFAGTYLNSPRHAEATPLIGDGTEDWTRLGNEFYVDASREDDVLAVIDFQPADSTATVMEFSPGSSTPLWSYTIYPCRTLTYAGWASRKPIRVADDGSTIAVAVVMYTPVGQRGRLFAFDAGNGTPAVDFPFPDGNVVAIEMSAGGEYIAMAGWPTLYVYDRFANAVRWSGAIGSGNDALAISGDGRYLAWGWTTAQLREWTGATYASVWSQTPGAGTYLGQCALSTDNTTLAVTWDNGNSMPNDGVLELYELPSLALLWSYDFVTGSARPRIGTPPALSRRGAHVDVASHMRFAPDGERVAVASWGDDFPELHVFDRAAPAPLFTLDTPGSMFDLDIVDGPDGTTYVTTCGKNVHAGTGGRGADLYAVEIPASTTGIDGGTPTSTAVLLQPNRPNPFRPRTTITYTLPGSGRFALTVHDLQGRLIDEIAGGEGSSSRRRAVWDGTDATGARRAPGVYWIRLETSSGVQSRKAVLLE